MTPGRPRAPLRAVSSTTRRRARRLAPLALLALAAAGAHAEEPEEGSAAPPRAVLDALLPEGRRTLPLEELVARVALEPGEARRAEEIGRDAHTSHHVLAMRGGESPHRHEGHELLVVVLRGHGTMRLGDETRPVGPGSVLYVPRGAVHAFANRSGEPAVAYAVYSPPFDGEDRVPAD